MRGRHRAGRKAPAAKSLIIAPSLPRSPVPFFFFFFPFFFPSRSRAGILHYPPRNSAYRYARNEFRCVLGAQQVGELSRGASKKADFASSRVASGPLSWSPGSVPFRSVPAVQIGERHSAERSGLTAPCPVEKWLGSRSCQTRPRVTGVHIVFARLRSCACDEWRDARVSLRRTERSHADFADFPQDSCETRGEDLRHIYRQVATYGSVLA